jgi:serine/threonine-protein kinase
MADEHRKDPSRSTGHPSRIHRGESRFQFHSTDARNRLAYLAIFYAMGFTLAYGSGIVLGGHLSWRLFTHLPFDVALVCILSALGIFVMARWKLVSETTLTRIALVWIVPAILGILVTEDWTCTALAPEVLELAREKHANMGISWACVVISVFPLLVRASVLQILISSLASAAMGPLYLLVFSWLYEVPLPEHVIFDLSFPLFVCAGIAGMSSAVIARFRKDVDRAQQLGSYRLEERLGKGGMGEVWRARHHMLVRPSAIKLIRPGALDSAHTGASPDSRILRRFEREVQATASLQSPHTISVYDFGTTDEGSFYYVMELLNGLDTRSLVERFGPLPEARVVHMLRQVCESLEEAHQSGLIHRDIKPANIFVCRLGLHFDFVKVLDFGLVKTIEDTKAADTRLTAEGIATGTPATMAPEVALGRPELDARIDIYSLGCVAYWLVTGQEVFEAETPMALVLKHVQEKPVLPSQRTELPLSGGFEELVMACLEKDPSDRPGSAHELLRRLQACPASDGWDRERGRQWWQKHMPEMAAEPARHSGDDSA